jgi:hypothetical protein
LNRRGIPGPRASLEEEVAKMTRFKKVALLLMFAATLASGFVLGCSKEPGTPYPNIPPQTTLSFSPDNGGSAEYRVRMNWFGWDEDGEIAFFETAWDKPDSVASWTKWIDIAGRAVVSTDSVFYLRAADEFDQTNGYAAHSFAVRAVDNDGARDASPESLSFTAFTALPETEITRGPAAVTGPMVTFEWTARDRDGVIAAYDYRLFAREDNEWVQVAPDPEVASSIRVGPDVTSVLFGPISGYHKFEVWATDDAGAADQTPAVSLFTVNPELAGAELVISTNVFGIHKFRGPIWPERYNTPMPIFNGERLLFAWGADASDYGGEVVGYRYAYDDTSTWPAWSIFARRYEVTPSVGRHSLYISALDNANEITRARIYFDVVEASLDEFILIVDDYTDKENQANWGTDTDRNSFYNGLLAGYERDRFEWQPSENLDSSGRATPPDVETLRGASTVIWYCDFATAASVIDDVFHPSQPTYNALAGYLRVGGNIVLCGTAVASQISGDTYPIVVDEADSSDAGVFLRDYLHLRRIDHSGYARNPNAPYDYGFCFHGAIPTPVGEAMGFEPVYIDSGDCSGELGKWFWYCDPPNYAPGLLHCGLNVEKLEVYQNSAIELYKIKEFLNFNFADEPCVSLYLSGDNRGNSCYMGFPLYYLQTPQVKDMLDKILQLFGEEKVQ